LRTLLLIVDAYKQWEYCAVLIGRGEGALKRPNRDLIIIPSLAHNLTGQSACPDKGPIKFFTSPPKFDIPGCITCNLKCCTSRQSSRVALSMKKSFLYEKICILVEGTTISFSLRKLSCN
jgi:hypothetical protein